MRDPAVRQRIANGIASAVGACLEQPGDKK
jgi:hypothetical protein